MLKRALFLLVFLLVLPSLPAYASLDLVLDGKPIKNGQVFVSDNQVMVPLRSVLEEWGYALAYQPEEGAIIISRDQWQVKLDPQVSEVEVNGQRSKLLAPLYMSGQGQSFISVPDLAQIFGCQGFWEPGRKHYSILSESELTEEGLVAHLLAADRQLLRVEYYNNPNFLIENGIAPPPVLVTKDDIEVLLQKHWSSAFIDRLWQAGSQAGRYVGFFSEGSLPLQYNKEIEVLELSESGARLRVLMPLWGYEGETDFVDIYYQMELDQSGKLKICAVE